MSKEHHLKHHDDRLFFHEEVALIALHDEKGTIEYGGSLSTILAGAIISELLLAGCIGLSSDESKQLFIKEERVLDDGLLDTCLVMIKYSNEPRSLQDWLTKFAWKEGMWEEITQKLCERGILSEEKAKVLFFFEKTIYPELNPRPEQQLVERLRRAIFSGGHVDGRTLVTLSLLYHSGLLHIPFSSTELKERKEHIEGLTKHNADITAEIVEAMEVVSLAALYIPIIATTIITNN